MAESLLLPGTGLTTGLIEHPAVHGCDQAPVFGKADEFVGRDQATVRVLPAHQGFEA
jgi:hypothetical protein